MNRIVALAIAALTSLFAIEATAQEREIYPVAYAERPLVLPHLGVAVDVEGFVGREFGTSSGYVAQPGDQTFGGASVYGGIGLGNRVEIDVSPGHFIVSPSGGDTTTLGSIGGAQFGNPWINTTVLVVRGDVELALGVEAILLNPNLFSNGYSTLETGLLLQPSATLAIHAGRRVRVETSAVLEAAFGPSASVSGSTVAKTTFDGGETIVEPVAVPANPVVGFRLPVSVDVSLVRSFALTAATGVTVNNFVRSPIVYGAPLAFGAVAALPAPLRPLGDLSANFSIPYFLTANSSSVTHTDEWQMTFVLRGFFFPGR